MKNSRIGNKIRQDRYYRKKVAIISAYKRAHGCVSCQETDPIVLEFHHRDRCTKLERLRNKKKLSNISQLSYDDLFKEIAKCDILCANCHRREEHRIRTTNNGGN